MIDFRKDHPFSRLVRAAETARDTVDPVASMIQVMKAEAEYLREIGGSDVNVLERWISDWESLFESVSETLVPYSVAARLSPWEEGTIRNKVSSGELTNDIRLTRTQMTTTDIQRLITEVPPGTTINIVSITVPSRISPMTKPAQIENADEEVTEKDVVQRLLNTRGDSGLKLREWTELLPHLSLRRLKSAVRNGEIQWYKKPIGKDHGATLVSPSAMLTYLRTLEA